MTGLALWAEHEGAPRVLVAYPVTLELARAIVERMERRGQWPEGAEAVVRDNYTTDKWLLADDWKKF